MSGEDSTIKRIGKCIVSAIFASLFGVVVAEVVANSLIEISITPVFSVVFGGAFIFLGGALIYRAFTSLTDALQRAFMTSFALLVFASGAFSFLLCDKWEPDVLKDKRAKCAMYAVVGLSLSFALSFSFTEFINMGLCDKCCRTDFENNPVISVKKQTVMIFVGTILLGAIQGWWFGWIDVEDDDQRHNKFTENLLISLPLGAVIGSFIGFMNQWFRSSPAAGYTQWSSKIPIINANDEI